MFSFFNPILLIDTDLGQGYSPCRPRGPKWRGQHDSNAKLPTRQRLYAVAHFRRWIGATPPEVFFWAKVGMRSATMTDPPRQQITARICANIPLCPEHFKLVLHVSEFAPTFPGQFVQILCRGSRE